MSGDPFLARYAEPLVDEPDISLGTSTLTLVNNESGDADRDDALWLGTRTFTHSHEARDSDRGSTMLMGTSTMTKTSGEGSDPDDHEESVLWEATLL
jgi:hypothetical protein